MTSVSGEEGNFTVQVTQHPRYVDMEKCIACGLCAEKCPRKVLNAFDGGLGKRKAAYVKYAQAVPLKYVIDPKECIFLTKGKCRACEKFCPTGAIKFDDEEKEMTLQVGAIILASGSEGYDPGNHDTFGYRKSPNIVTSLEFERVLSASGPYGGHLVRPSDGKEPKKIAWLQCIGSRDVHLGARGYCSGICCTQAVKEAMLAKEHCKGDLDAAVFYIDIRTFGKDFERYYNRARDDAGVRFIKSKITFVEPLDDEGRHCIHYVDESGMEKYEGFDIVVLSIGLGVEKEGEEIAKKLGIPLDSYNFAATSSFDPVKSAVPGIYVCGTCESPKDIPSSVVDASAASGAAGSRLVEVRGTLTKEEVLPEEADVRGETPRTGVFVCCCGTNIAGFLDVPAVVDFAKTLPSVVYAEQNLFSCSQDSQDKISNIIREQHLNRVVVAACTPKTHEPLFRATLTKAGINPYLFEMGNIRNQCSWVHQDNFQEATEKAKDLARMAVAKVNLLEPLKDPILNINENALVVGGGLAGMTAAMTMAEQGYHTYLIEKTEVLGGQARYLHQTWRGEDIQPFLSHMIQQVQSNERIEVLLNANIDTVTGFVGNFETSVKAGGEGKTLKHGITVIASGASEYKPEGYLYGEDERVLTGLELQHRLAHGEDSLDTLNAAVFIQCVGSRIPERPHCSRVCCTQSIQSALQLKSLRPDAEVYVLYRTMRPYGLREDLYREARMRGVHFQPFHLDPPLTVEKENGHIRVVYHDRILKRLLEIRPDLLVLASAVMTDKVNPLAQLYKIPQNEDGFFVEAHAKLRPVDFATDGVFVCGLAHAPKSVDESIAQAQAAAARAVALLAAKTLPVSGMVAAVIAADCSRCGVCISLCPYSAPNWDEKSGKAFIESSLCKGCGLCVASCRSGAINLKGFDMPQIMAMIEKAC